MIKLVSVLERAANEGPLKGAIVVSVSPDP